MDCARLHGATAGWVPKSFVDQLSTTLCTGTPSLGILERIDQIISTYTPDLAKESGYGTNVLGNATEVSLYYTTTSGSATHTTATATTTTTAAPGSKPADTGTKTGSGTAGATATGTGSAGSARILGMGTCLGTVVLAVLVVVAG